MDDSALALAKLVNSEDFQRKLNQLLAQQKAAEAAVVKADKAKSDAEATMAAMAQLQEKQTAELAAAKADHDKSANEAAARIGLANSLKAEQDKIKAGLDAREADLAEREKAVASAHGNFTAALRQLGLTTP